VFHKPLPLGITLAVILPNLQCVLVDMWTEMNWLNFEVKRSKVKVMNWATVLKRRRHAHRVLFYHE